LWFIAHRVCVVDSIESVSLNFWVFLDRDHPVRVHRGAVQASTTGAILCFATAFGVDPIAKRLLPIMVDDVFRR